MLHNNGLGNWAVSFFAYHKPLNSVYSPKIRFCTSFFIVPCRNLRFPTAFLLFVYRCSTVTFCIISPTDKLSGEGCTEGAAYPRKGDIMHKIRTETRCPPTLIIHIFLIQTVVFEGTADFFYSTKLFPSLVHIPKSNHIFNTSASALRWVRFFFVIKCLFLTSYRSRAPLFGLEFLTFKNLKTGGNQNEN